MGNQFADTNLELIEQVEVDEFLQSKEVGLLRVYMHYFPSEFHFGLLGFKGRSGLVWIDVEDAKDVLEGEKQSLNDSLPNQYKERHWDLKQLVGSGGMPSSHSATVTSLAIAVGLHYGFGSSSFATAMIFCMCCKQFIYGVLFHAEKQAEVLNQIVYGLPSEHPLADTRPLRELVGHTPTQVSSVDYH
ncbi:uncharacterized membrane protein YuiD-like [Dioscorea cayenensis subsp. rotundata]|uniref:Uncharacterized membrane protein YuiD-like n=1 Tax=Dioscorea cayennensis subsp. rotundata TaxID=55577 RepID=A0AB40AHQ6_DIOCR|nr:uncharacterized membrane protein YuiD-like [Dioscorea cayenensis subsp. rotundata]